MRSILDEQRRFHNRLPEDLRGLWKSYVALRDRAKIDPLIAFLADLRFKGMRSTTSQFGMQSTLTLLREADPRRYGALPANVWRGTIKRLAPSQAAFIERAHENVLNRPASSPRRGSGRSRSWR